MYLRMDSCPHSLTYFLMTPDRPSISVSMFLLLCVCVLLNTKSQDFDIIKC